MPSLQAKYFCGWGIGYSSWLEWGIVTTSLQVTAINFLWCVALGCSHLNWVQNGHSTLRASHSPLKPLCCAESLPTSCILYFSNRRLAGGKFDWCKSLVFDCLISIAFSNSNLANLTPFVHGRGSMCLNKQLFDTVGFNVTFIYMSDSNHMKLLHLHYQ